MSLLFTFMELDNIYESANQEIWLNRDMLIDNIKAAGKQYNFDKYSDSQLYRIWERIKDNSLKYAKYDGTLDSSSRHDTCPECGIPLNDGGTCPVCDDGEEDYL